MTLLAVNFHYIGDESAYKKGIYPVSAEKFLRQLDELGRHFTFISGRDLADAIAGTKTLPERACLITFDDGLACQIDIALPILDKKGIPAMFFVSSFPYTDARLLTVHKIHWLLSQLSDEAFRDELVLRAGGAIDFNSPELIAAAQKKYRYDSVVPATVKYVLNVLLSEELRAIIIDEIFATHVSNESEFVRGWYIHAGSLKLLAQRGYLGLHSHNHIKMTGDVSDVVANVTKNKNVIEEMTGEKLFAFSYPYGSRLDINETVTPALAELGISFAFTMERAFNTTLTQPLLLARADTNDVPGGKSPCFVVQDNNITITGNFAASRQMFFKE